MTHEDKAFILVAVWLVSFVLTMIYTIWDCYATNDWHDLYDWPPIAIVLLIGGPVFLFVTALHWWCHHKNRQYGAEEDLTW